MQSLNTLIQFDQSGHFVRFASEAASKAGESEASAGLFGALGLDLRLLIIQALAFLVLVAILGKFVYPALVKAIDDRREAIETGLRDAKSSHEALE